MKTDFDITILEHVLEFHSSQLGLHGGIFTASLLMLYVVMFHMSGVSTVYCTFNLAIIIIIIIMWFYECSFLLSPIIICVLHSACCLGCNVPCEVVYEPLLSTCRCECSG